MKYRTKNLFQFLLLFIVISCKEKKPLVVFGSKQIEFSNLSLETIVLSEKTFSGSGFLRVQNDSIYYFDDLFMTCCIYDMQGNMQRRILGKGDGVDEIRKFSYYGFAPGLGHILFGNNYQFSWFDTRWKKVKPQYAFNWMNRKKKYSTSDLSNINMYDFNHENSPFDSKMLTVIGADKALVPIMITMHANVKTNWVNNPDDYYKGAYSVGIINLKTGRLESGFANRPSIYKDKHLPLQDYVYIALKRDSILLSYKADSLIYVYNSKYELEYAFGSSGIDINTDFPQISNLKEFDERPKISKIKFGWYQSIYADTVNNLFFRSYIKCLSCKESGLQIYRGTTLVADVVVPKRFNIIAQFGEYYYADGLMDEENNLLGVYRFKIPKK